MLDKTSLLMLVQAKDSHLLSGNRVEDPSVVPNVVPTVPLGYFPALYSYYIKHVNKFPEPS